MILAHSQRELLWAAAGNDVLVVVQGGRSNSASAGRGNRLNRMDGFSNHLPQSTFVDLVVWLIQMESFTSGLVIRRMTRRSCE